MEENTTKGTVTSLSSLFPVDEAQKATKRVEEAILEKQNELNNISQFISDNNNLINLISRLPDDLHHDVMVPFGKAAFFSGKLIHTNELMVLLGEGYYAERTAKQTVDILKRRGKALGSQVESLKANLKDLEAEASFFDSTASEAAEGLVEIREDYVGENSTEGQSKSDTEDKKVGVEEDEYARIMSRLDELEKEELEAEGNEGSDEDELADTAESDNETDKNENSDAIESGDESFEDEETYTAERKSESHGRKQAKANISPFPSQTYTEIRNPPKQPKVENATIEVLSDKYGHQLDIADQPNCTGLTVQPVPKGEMWNSGSQIHSKKSISDDKALKHPGAKKETETVSSARSEVPMQTSKSRFDSSRAFTSSIIERTNNSQTIPQDQAATLSQPKNPEFDSSKAFTGSIIERTHNMQTSTSSQPSSTQPSKPVSRFKMQRR